MEFSTKVMHSMNTALYFPWANKKEKDLGKLTETIQSINGFLTEYWLMTILEKLVKAEGRMWVRIFLRRMKAMGW